MSKIKTNGDYYRELNERFFTDDHGEKMAAAQEIMNVLSSRDYEHGNENAFLPEFIRMVKEYLESSSSMHVAMPPQPPQYYSERHTFDAAAAARQSISSPADDIFSGNRPLGQLPPIGSSRGPSIASSPAAVPSTLNELEDIYNSSDSSVIESLPSPSVVSNFPETIAPSIKHIFSSFARGSVKITVSSAIDGLRQVASQLADSIKQIGDSTIDETKKRRKIQEQQETAKIVSKAEELLKTIGDKEIEFTTNDVLLMVQYEELIEMVMDEVLPESVSEIPPLLVIPILDIVSHYDEYFSYNDNINPVTVNNAFSEFRNKQRIRDKVRQLSMDNGLTQGVTLNEVIARLFTLYNRNFNLENTSEKALSVNGNVRVIKSIHTREPDTKLTTIPSNNLKKTDDVPVLSAINYSEIWDLYSKPTSVVNNELVALMEPVDAAPDVTPHAGVGIPRGRNTREWEIEGDAGAARFTEPLVHVEVDIDEPEELYNSQDSAVSDFMSEASQDSNAGISPATADPSARFQVLTSELRTFGQPFSEAVENRAIALASRQKAAEKKITREQAERIAAATEKTEEAESLTRIIVALSNNLKKNEDPAIALNQQQKERTWDRELHRIFLTWYNRYKEIESQYRMDGSPASSSKKTPSGPPTGFGGKYGSKSSKNHKKHNKKHTRKNGKRSTRKLRKNHKKRSGHTKKH